MSALTRLLTLVDEVLERDRRIVLVSDCGSRITLAEAMGHPPDPAPDLARGIKAFVAELESHAESGRTSDLRWRFTDETVSDIMEGVERRLSGSDDEEDR